jgi:hypothetical protein
MGHHHETRKHGEQMKVKEGTKMIMIVHLDDGNTGIFQGHFERYPGEVVQVDEKKPDHCVVHFKDNHGMEWDEALRYIDIPRANGRSTGVVDLNYVFYPAYWDDGTLFIKTFQAVQLDKPDEQETLENQ